MRRNRSTAFHAFTLVELLVVIGIIAVLIGVLLPVLSGVAARGRDLQCQSNIHQCVQLILTYAAENRGQLPYGYYYARGGGHPEGWGAAGSDISIVTLWSVVSRMSSGSYSGQDLYRDKSLSKAAPILRCPEALQVQQHPSSYAASMAAFHTPYEDALMGARRSGSPWTRLIETPTRLTQCVPFTALMWDTAIGTGDGAGISHILGGDIDGQRIRTGAIHPQTRYYSASDRFASIAPGTYGNQKPVVMHIPGYAWFNIDPIGTRTGGLPGFPYEGNLRFRHSRNTTCNVGYADGHVGQFTGKFKKDGTPIAHDAIRKSFMVKWPSGAGIGPDPSLPH